MSSSNDLFLLMFNLSQLHDKDRILNLFIEGMNETFKPVLFHYLQKGKEDHQNLEIRTIQSRFGFIRIENVSPLPQEHSKLVYNAVQMLAVILERLDFYEKLRKEKETAEEISDKRFHDLRQIEWMLINKYSRRMDAVPEYGDLSLLNCDGLIKKYVEKEQLRDIVSDYLDLLETSAAIYERNGDYALGIFSSGWCQLMDSASRRLCETMDNRKALASGKWLCHESCWKDASLKCIQTGKPEEIECSGSIQMYAVPVKVNGEIIGAMNFGFGSPPTDEGELTALSKKYKIPVKELRQAAQSYKKRPQFIIDYAKKRIQKSATYLGNVIERRQAEEELRTFKNDLEKQVAEKTKELQERVKELERFYDATIKREYRIKELKNEIEKLKGGKS